MLNLQGNPAAPPAGVSNGRVAAERLLLQSHAGEWRTLELRLEPAVTVATDFELTALDGTPLPLSAYAGKVLLVVNTASRCGFTPQYAGLERLWRQYAAQGLVVLGCPCDQFGHQEPGDAAAIQAFCSLDYGVSFPMSAKLQVNGTGAHPLWRWLQREKRGALGIAAIKWNFSKFLVGRDGRVIARYAPTARPESLEGDIRAALG